MVDPGMPSPTMPALRATRRGKQISKWIARVVLAALCLLGLVLATVPNGRAALRAALVMPTLLGDSQSVPLKESFAQVTHESVALDAKNGNGLLDIYRPSTSSTFVPNDRQTLFIIPGVGDHRNDPTYVNLATAFAQTGIVVVLVTTPDLLQGNILPEQNSGIVHAFDYIENYGHGINPQKVGVISVGITGALAASVEALPDLLLDNPPVFIGLIDTPDSMINVLRAIGQRGYLSNGTLVSWQPDAAVIQSFATTFANRLPRSDSGIWSNAFVNGQGTLSASQLNRLSPETRAIYHLLAGDQSDRVDDNLAMLSDSIKVTLLFLSPQYYIKQLNLPLYLLSGSQDTEVPVTEGRTFANELALNHALVQFTETSLFAHDLTRASGRSASITDNLRLFTFLSRLLARGA
jgi:hypothetical protein